jgi:hypothetical protein
MRIIRYQIAQLLLKYFEFATSVVVLVDIIINFSLKWRLKFSVKEVDTKTLISVVVKCYCTIEKGG